MATGAEITMEMLKGSYITSTPKQDLMKRLKTFVDVTSEAHDIPPPMGTTHMGGSVSTADTEEDWDSELKRGHKPNLPDEFENISPKDRKRQDVESQKFSEEMESVGFDQSEQETRRTSSYDATS